jgi:hypothetical protein
MDFLDESCKKSSEMGKPRTLFFRVRAFATAKIITTVASQLHLLFGCGGNTQRSQRFQNLQPDAQPAGEGDDAQEAMANGQQANIREITIDSHQTFA